MTQIHWRISDKTVAIAQPATPQVSGQAELNRLASLSRSNLPVAPPPRSATVEQSGNAPRTWGSPTLDG